MDKSINKSWGKYNIPPIPTLAESEEAYKLKITVFRVLLGALLGGLFGALDGGLVSNYFQQMLNGVPDDRLVGGSAGVWVGALFGALVVGKMADEDIGMVAGVWVGILFGGIVGVLTGGEIAGLIGMLALGVFTGSMGMLVGGFPGMLVGGLVNMIFPYSKDLYSKTEGDIPKLLKVGNIEVALAVFKKIDKTDFLQNIMTKKDYRSIAYLLAQDNTIYDALLSKYAQNGDKVALEILGDLGVREEKISSPELLKVASGEVKTHLNNSLMSKFISKKDFKLIKNGMTDDYLPTPQEREIILQLAIQDKAWEWIGKHAHQLEIFQQKMIDPLIIGICAGDENIVKQVIAQGSTIYQKTTYQEWNNSNAFEGAFISGNRKIIELFIDMHKDIHKALPNGDSILHLATRYNIIWLIQEHLDKNYDPNTVDHRGFALLDYVVDYGLADIGILIIEHGGKFA